MSESANTLAGRITGEATEAPNTTDPIVEDDESQDEVLDVNEESTEEDDSTEEPEEEELPANIKDILSKNRKAVREAEARAVAAEKALKAKDSTETEPSAEDSKFKELYLKSAAKSALIDAGITTGTDRFLKMLDLSSAEVDDSGAISGLEDQIADLKEEWADVLAPKPARKTVGKTDGARREAPSVPKSSAELLASRISY
jgi:hypothetical protein